MRRHAETHISGKLAGLVGALESGERQHHPVFMEGARALYDDDMMTGREPGQYLVRATRLLAEWTGYTASASDDGSLFTVLGMRDTRVVLVFDRYGPQFWRRTDSRLGCAKTFWPRQYYAMGLPTSTIGIFSRQME